MSTAIAPSQDDLASWRPQGPPAKNAAFRLGVLVIAVVAATWRTWTISSWGWIQDDWIYVVESQRMPTFDYLFQNYNQHLMPGQFAIAKLVTAIAPLDYALAGMWVVGLALLALGAWVMALREIFGEVPGALLPLVLLALSPIYLPVSLWWAASLQTFPLVLSMGLVVWFVARHLRRRDRLSLVLCGASYVLGLLFWQKALFVVIPALFVALLLTDGRLMTRLRAMAPPMLVLVAISVLYLPLYVGLTRAPVPGAMKTELFAIRGIGETLAFFFSGLFTIGLPALAGGPWGGVPSTTAVYDAAPATNWLPLFAVATVAAVGTLWYRRRGWLILGMLAGYALASWWLVLSSSRYDAVGLVTVREARYSADILPVAFLTLAFVTLPTLQERASRSTPTLRVLPTWLSKRVPIMRALALAGVSASVIFGNSIQWQRIEPTTPKPWIDNILADAKMARGQVLYDSVSPSHLMLPAFFPEHAHLAAMLEPLSAEVTFNQPTPQMLTARSDGRLVEAAIDELGATSPGPIQGCGYLVKPGETAFLPMKTQMFDWTWFAQLTYFSEKGGPIAVRTDRRTTEMDLDAGLGQMQFVVTDSVSALAIRADPSAGPICVTSVQFGNIRATDSLGIRPAQSSLSEGPR